MPRKAPTQVIEHRLSLSDYERKHLTETTKELIAAQRLNAYSRAAGGGGVALVGVGLVIGAVMFGLGYTGSSVADYARSSKRKTEEFLQHAISTGGYEEHYDRLIAEVDAEIETVNAQLGDNPSPSSRTALIKRRDSLYRERNALVVKQKQAGLAAGALGSGPLNWWLNYKFGMDV